MWMLASPAADDARQRASALDAVVRRIGGYVDNYGARASLFVASERYEQRTDGSTSARSRQRTTVAEVALLRVEALGGWQQFRDVTHVDGRPLEDRTNRLVDALLSGARGLGEARRISDESSRFNIGLIERNFNVPTTALFFFSSAHHDRFRIRARDTGKDPWRLDWEEVQTPTFIRDAQGTSIPTRGSLWVNSADGTIVRTLLEASMRGRNGQMGSGRVEVTYERHEALRKWLPVRMVEEWTTNMAGGSWGRVRGTAEYSNYREFTTSARIK